mgnify:CR=1 FL=1
MKKLSFITIALAIVITTGNFVAIAATNPLAGKIIALDAGHGGGENGATNTINGVLVTEAEVNMSVVNALKLKLEGQGAYVVVASQLASRKDRVDDVIAKCAVFDLNNDGVGDKCNALVSIHHNGSTDASYDGTLVIYNEKKDKLLAEKMLAALIPLTGNSDGLENGGYGMTVYGNLVSVITEAYYITNDGEARAWLSGTRTPQEVDAQIAGLTSYFASQTGGKGGKPR